MGHRDGLGEPARPVNGQHNAASQDAVEPPGRPSHPDSDRDSDHCQHGRIG